MESKDEVCLTTIDPDRQEVSELESRLTDRANEILEYCGLEGQPLDAKLDQVRARLRKGSEVKKEYEHLLTQKVDLINDPMYPGGYYLHPLIKRIINTPEFHRLKHLKQLGGAYYVYPGANHTRFDHSLGVSHLAEELISHLKMTRNDLELKPNNILCVKVAGLCHDLGQGPFSSVFKTMVVRKIIDGPHESWCARLSVLIFRKILRDNPKVLLSFVRSGLEKVDVQFIEEMIYHDKKDLPPKGRKQDEERFLYEVVINSENRVDVEKWDHLARDSHHLGINIPFQWQRLMKLSFVVEDEREGKAWHIGFRDKEVPTIYEMFDSEQSLLRKAYKHKAVHAVELMMTDAILLCQDVELIQAYSPQSDEPVTVSIGQAVKEAKKAVDEECLDLLQGYLALTDSVLDHIMNARTIDHIHSSEKLKQARNLILRIQNRKLYKLAVRKPIIIPRENPSEMIERVKILKKKWHILNDEIAKHSEPPFSPEDIGVEIVTFGSENHSDPVKKVLFTPKTNLKRCDPQIVEKVPETIRRGTNTEYQLRVFVKNEKLSDKDVQSAFEKWYQEFRSQCLKNEDKVPHTSDVSKTLDGVDICAETTLTLTNKAQPFIWKDYGLTLDIPSDALPDDVDQCVLDITASISGDYAFPNGFQPVSPIFWIRCEPPCKFKKAITMGVHHCAKNKTRLRFAKASCGQKERPFAFSVLPQPEGKVSKGNTDPKTFGFIQLNRFSGVVGVQEGSDELQCTAKVFYYPKNVHNCEVHFTVTLDTPAHSAVVKEKHQSAIEGPDLQIEFQPDSEKVSLNIPKNGMLLDDGSEILPMMHPAVERKNINSFEKGKRIPHCVLWIKRSSEAPTTTIFMHRVDLLGVKHPCTYFRLLFDFSSPLNEGPVPEQVRVRPTPFTLQRLLQLTWNNDRGDIESLSVIESVEDKWCEIGVLVGLQFSRLKSLEREHGDHIRCLIFIFDSWIRQGSNSYPPTWEGLVRLLRAETIWESRVASKVEEALLALDRV